MSFITKNQSSDGVGNNISAYRVTSRWMTISIEGILDDDATVYIEHSHDGNTYVKTGDNFRSAGKFVVEIESASGYIRSQLVRATGLTDVSIYVTNSEPKTKYIVTKYGRNPDIDTGSAPEDVIFSGGTYTGFPSTGENIQVLSSSANDAGSLVSSGSATGGSHTTLEDDAATFVTDGVLAGDFVINDTKGEFGVVSNVTETLITVHHMNGSKESVVNSAGDAYRVVTSVSTGAAFVRLSHLRNSEFEPLSDIFVILDGTTPVTVVGDFMRSTRGRSIGENNAGTITCRQATTTSNVYWTIPVGTCSTFIAAYSVAKGEVALLKNMIITLSRSSGSLGSATVSLKWRPRGESFYSRTMDLTTGYPVEFGLDDYSITYGEMTDIKLTVDDVSDSNSAVSCEMDLAIEQK